jgi:hypothetical protein
MKEAYIEGQIEVIDEEESGRTFLPSTPLKVAA